MWQHWPLWLFEHIVMPVWCEKAYDGGCEGTSLEISANMKAAQLHSAEWAASPCSSPAPLPLWKSHWWRGGIMNRQEGCRGVECQPRPKWQREGWGWGRKPWQAAGAWQRRSQGRWHMAKTSLSPQIPSSVFYLWKALRMSLKMKGLLLKHEKIGSVQLVIWLFFCLLARGYFLWYKVIQ